MKKVCLSLVVLMSTALLAQSGQSEFKPVTQVPASDQLPSAPLVIAAYAFVWLAFVAYVWLMWRKLGKVEDDLNTLAARLGKKRP
jgi:hypothetical protein